MVVVTGLVDDLSPALALLAHLGLDAGWQAGGRVTGHVPDTDLGDPVTRELAAAMATEAGLDLPDEIVLPPELFDEFAAGRYLELAQRYLEARLKEAGRIAVVDAGAGWFAPFWKAAAEAAGTRAVFAVIAAPPARAIDDLAAAYGIARQRAQMVWAAYHWRLLRQGGPGAIVLDQDLVARFPRHGAARLAALLGPEFEIATKGEGAPPRRNGAAAVGWRQPPDWLLSPAAGVAAQLRRAIADGEVARMRSQPFDALHAFYDEVSRTGEVPPAAPIPEPARPAVSGARQAPQGDEPFFVLGAPRSGTTLLRNLLRQHPRLVAPEETHFFRWANPAGSDEFNKRYFRTPVLKQHRQLDGVSDEEITHLLQTAGDRREMMEGYAALFRAGKDKGRTRWFDKSPQNVYGLPLLVAHYPEARIVHIHRHPVEVAASAMAGRNLARHTLKAAVNVWLEPVQIIDTMRPILGDRLIEVAFDDLVRRPRTVLDHLCRALDLEPFWFDTSMVSEEAGPHLYPTVAGPDDIAYIEARCERYMRAYGYGSRLDL